MDIDTRKRICQLVAGIILADEILDEQEEAFVGRLIKSFGIGATGREVIFPLVDRAQAAAQIKDLPKDAQDEAMRLLIAAACVDGQMAPEERDYLRAVAKAIDMPERTLATRVADALGDASPTRSSV